MNTLELIKTRKSVRTFDGRKITEEDRKALVYCRESSESTAL